MDFIIPLLILAIPLGMFLLLGLAGMKMSHKLAGVLGTLGMGVVLVLSYFTAFTYFFSGNPEFVSGGERLQAVIFNVDWLAFTENLVIRLGFLLDPISAMMLIVIPTISSPQSPKLRREHYELSNHHQSPDGCGPANPGDA